jgi:hypothetical protein
LYCQSFFDLYLLHYLFGIFWSLYCQFFFDLYLLDYPFGIFWSLYCQFYKSKKYWQYNDQKIPKG